MASALAYRTLIGLLPVVIVATLIFKSVAGQNFTQLVKQGLDGLGLEEIKIVPPGTNQEQVSLSSWLLEIISGASKLDLSGLGIVGASILLFSSIWVVITIEESFNLICRATHGRSWVRRFITYWFALTAGPLLLGALPIVGSYVTKSADMLPNWGWLLWVVRSMWGFFVVNAEIQDCRMFLFNSTNDFALSLKVLMFCLCAMKRCRRRRLWPWRLKNRRAVRLLQSRCWMR